MLNHPSDPFDPIDPLDSFEPTVPPIPPIPSDPSDPSDLVDPVTVEEITRIGMVIAEALAQEVDSIHVEYMSLLAQQPSTPRPYRELTEEEQARKDDLDPDRIQDFIDMALKTALAFPEILPADFDLDYFARGVQVTKELEKLQLRIRRIQTAVAPILEILRRDLELPEQPPW